MDNNTQRGDVLTFTAPSGGVVSGTAYKIGQTLVIAVTSAAVGERFAGACVGCHDVPKVSAQAWAEGDAIYWDDTAKLFTTVSTSNLLAGGATAVAANPTSTGNVRLNGTTRADGA